MPIRIKGKSVHRRCTIRITPRKRSAARGRRAHLNPLRRRETGKIYCETPTEISQLDERDYLLMDNLGLFPAVKKYFSNVKKYSPAVEISNRMRGDTDCKSVPAGASLVDVMKPNKISSLLIMKTLILFISCIFLTMPAYCQKDTARLEQQVINRAIKGSLGVEYINADHSAVNGKIFIARTPISPITYLFPPQVPDSSEYGIISYYSKYIDNVMYENFKKNNETSIEIDETDFDEYIISFTKQEDAKQFLNSELDDEGQSKKLGELLGDITVTVISRPGFNEEHNKALVYIAIMRSAPDEWGLYGIGGGYYIYEKTADGWELLDMVLLG